MLKPFFCYFGGKYRVAMRYPPPVHDYVVEPFAGAAGYATRHHKRQVILYDRNPIISGLWKYLIAVESSEILALPVGIQHIDEARVCQEAKWLIGFWLAKGRAAPALKASPWMLNKQRTETYWGPEIRDRIARQVRCIRHWQAYTKTWENVRDREATWFVDPPYQYQGQAYRRFSHVDFPALGEWCRSREGQVIVCEGPGADWLPFRPFREVKGTHGKGRIGVSEELVWTQGC